MAAKDDLHIIDCRFCYKNLEKIYANFCTCLDNIMSHLVKTRNDIVFAHHPRCLKNYELVLKQQNRNKKPTFVDFGGKNQVVLDANYQGGMKVINIDKNSTPENIQTSLTVSIANNDTDLVRPAIEVVEDDYLDDDDDKLASFEGPEITTLANNSHCADCSFCKEILASFHSIFSVQLNKLFQHLRKKLNCLLIEHQQNCLLLYFAESQKLLVSNGRKRNLVTCSSRKIKSTKFNQNSIKNLLTYQTFNLNFGRCIATESQRLQKLATPGGDFRSKSQFYCEICNRMFDAQDIVRHYRFVHSQNRIKTKYGYSHSFCEFCNQYVFAWRDQFDLHLFDHYFSFRKILICSICDANGFKSEREFRKHYKVCEATTTTANRMHRQRRNVVCKICGATDSFNTSLTAHIREHLKEIVDYQQQQLAAVNNHKRNFQTQHHGVVVDDDVADYEFETIISIDFDEPKECSSQSYISDTNKIFVDNQQHVDYFKKVDSNNMIMTGTNSVAIDQLRKNICQVSSEIGTDKNLHMAENYELAFSTGVNKNKDDVKNLHISNNGGIPAFETGARPFQCTICNTSFTRLYSLKRHMDEFGHLHQSVNLPTDFSSSASTTRTTTIVGGLGRRKDFKCVSCQRRFADRWHLNRHLSTSTHFKNSSRIRIRIIKKKTTMHKCEYCSKLFFNALLLHRHFQKCASKSTSTAADDSSSDGFDFKFNCKKCVFRTNRKDKLRDHLKTNKHLQSCAEFKSFLSC